MRRAPAPAVDLAVYFVAIPVLLRNPTIVVVPLLMAFAGVLVNQLLMPSGGSLAGTMASGLAGLVLWLLQLFGVGAACVIADDAWRHRVASFDRGWEETSRRTGDIFFAAIGFTLLLGVAQYAGALLGALGLVLMALALFFLIWTLPAAAVGGVSGGLAIQVSVDRVRAHPLAAGITTVVSILALVGFAWQLPALVQTLLPATTPPIAARLIDAVFEAIAFGYIATILTKTYSDASFGRR